jgi:hypothetical protein
MTLPTKGLELLSAFSPTLLNNVFHYCLANTLDLFAFSLLSRFYHVCMFPAARKEQGNTTCSSCTKEVLELGWVWNAIYMQAIFISCHTTEMHPLTASKTRRQIFGWCAGTFHVNCMGSGPGAHDQSRVWFCFALPRMT